jgi:hypothetical protein
MSDEVVLVHTVLSCASANIIFNVRPYLAPSLPQEAEDPALAAMRSSITQKDVRLPGATTESVQVDFGSQGPPPKSQARSEHPASGARRLRATCQTKVKSGDKILYLHNAGAFGELYLPLSPWLLVTCHTNISRRAALRRRSCSLVLQVFARIKRDYVQYISIVLCEVMLWSSSSCMLSCWNMINNLTSSSLQPLFAARMEKYYAMMCYIAPQGSKSLQPVRFC